MDATEAVMATIMVVVVVGSVALVGASAVHGQTDGGNECVSVSHDFRTDAHIDEYEASGSVTNGAGNTIVSVEDTSGFVRLPVENPNGYCTTLVVDLPPEIVTAAELGDVTSINGSDVTADWYVRQDLETGEQHTRVEIQMPGGTDATLAPSKPRIVSLSWTAEAQETKDSFFDRFSGDLNQTEYTVHPVNGSDSVSVDLSNSDDTRVVEDWQAIYTDSDGEKHPVTNEPGEPVHYVSHEGERVEFVFEDRDATVEFNADPSFLDRTEHRVRSYTSGIDRIDGLLDRVPFVVTPTSGGVSA